MELKRRLNSMIWKLSVFFKRLYRAQKHVFWILSALAFIICFFFMLKVDIKERRQVADVFYTLDFNYREELIEQKLRASILEDKGAGCEMPYMDPFSDVAMFYNKETPKIVCEGLDWVECYHCSCTVIQLRHRGSLLVTIERNTNLEGQVWVSRNYIHCTKYEILHTILRGESKLVATPLKYEQSKCYVVDEILNNTDNIVCNYKDIVYVNDSSYYIEEPVKIFGSDKYVLNKSDHVKVSCTGRSKNSLGIMSSRWFGYKAGLRPVPVKPSEGREQTINIMVLCFDSTSRNGFIRKMPKSYKVLQNEINATILKRYNIVGEGTSNALYPILTGLDLPDWQTFPKHKCLDHKTFLFHHLKEDGYRTAYFEDMPWIGTFQRFFNGFDSRPAGHYLRAFLMEESSTGRKWWHGVKGRYCIGSVAQYALMLNLTKQFLHLDGKRFCFTFIADISHDDFNHISSADDDVVEFLRYFMRQGWMDDTLLIVMGDHGAKYDTLRKSYQGRIEERLPLVAVRLPSKLVKSRPRALTSLKDNAEVLTTPYDLHTTLLDAVGLMKHRNLHFVPGSDLPRGMSLLEPIPKSRSCGEAGILPHWCACAKWRNMSTSNTMYKKTAEFLLDYINNMTHEKRALCAVRTLKSIQWVLIYMPHREMMKAMEVKGLFGVGKPVVIIDKRQYQVKIVTEPGDAMFEASMVYYVKERYFMISDEDVSRISAYGHEPDCVLATHPYLNKYCYCTNSSGGQTEG